MRALEHAATCGDCEIREDMDSAFCEAAEAILDAEPEDS